MHAVHTYIFMYGMIDSDPGHLYTVSVHGSRIEYFDTCVRCGQDLFVLIVALLS